MGYLTVIGTFNYLSYEAMNIHEKCLRRPSTRARSLVVATSASTRFERSQSRNRFDFESV
jgi:hypothetical protein